MKVMDSGGGAEGGDGGNDGGDWSKNRSES